MNSKKYWESKHLEYASKDWIDKPTIFAQFSYTYFPKFGNILELGSGQGQDSRFFAKKGHKVLATDFSVNALSFLKEKSKNEYLEIETRMINLKKKLPFNNNSFNVVYSHLALHYFDHKTTEVIFNEIARVLKRGGIIAVLLNTLEDPEIKQFEKIEPGYYSEPGKIKKRYFSPQSLKEFINDKFVSLILDAKGETYKDEIKTLIRFIGRKK